MSNTLAVAPESLEDLANSSVELIKQAELLAGENQTLQTKNAELQKKIDTLEADRLRLLKVASQSPAPVFTAERVKLAMVRLKDLKVLSEDGVIKAAVKLNQDPDFALGLMVKMAENVSQAPADGGGRSKAAGTGSVQVGDVDGWDNAAQGKDVKVR